MTEARNEIIAAIAKATGAVKRIGRDGKNTHDNYQFASIDAFLEMTGPICAANGLVVLMDEISLEDFTRKGKYGDSSWMRATFSVEVHHASGQSLPAVRRSVEVLRNGAQAYGSAQSYVLKQFLRALMQISTGDQDDADHRATDTSAATPDAPKPEARAPKPDPKPEQDRVLTKQEGEAIIDAIAARHDRMELVEYMGALAKGPMAFAANHPKIKTAAAQKHAEFDQADIDKAKANPVVLGELRVPTDNPFAGEKVPF